METETQTATATPSTTPSKARKHVAIIAPTSALAQAMESVLATKLKGHTFSHVQRISERPAGAQIASLGLPSFIPGGGATVLSFGSRYDDKATPEDRRNQWDTLRSKESTMDDVLEELGNFTEYNVLSGSEIKDVKLAVADVMLEIAEASTPEEELAAYKQGFHLLKDALS